MLKKHKVVNLSSYVLDDNEDNALFFGLNFSVPPTHEDKQRICLFRFWKISQTEYEYLTQVSAQKDIIDLIKHNGESIFKASLLVMARSFCSITLDKNTLINNKEIKEVIKKIKSNTDLMFSKSGKGIWIVLMDKAQYLNKIQEIINNTSKFKLLGPAVNLIIYKRRRRKL